MVSLELLFFIGGYMSIPTAFYTGIQVQQTDLLSLFSLVIPLALAVVGAFIVFVGLRKLMNLASHDDLRGYYDDFYR